MIHEATRRQIDAANPRVSTWLSANAGSGKTRVLTDRVARLLLEGVEPQNILCLTYTKAAAAEMQNRLFQRLGAWAMMDDAALREDLKELGQPGAIPAADLRGARTLFARAIETPGGLKIQTIHAFCAGLLRRFPLEAGVSPQFVEMEDRTADLLRAEVLDAMSEGPEVGLVDGIARFLTDEKLVTVTRDIVGRRDAFATLPPPGTLAALFDVPAGLTLQALVDRTVGATERQVIAGLAAACAAGSSTDQKAAAKLAGIDPNKALSPQDLAMLEDVFLTGGSAKAPFTAKIGAFPTKGTRTAHPDLCAEAEDLMTAVEAARPLRLALAALERTEALYRFATVFVRAYEARKLALGLLDFDDLIAKARALLTDRLVADWVLFKLDGGIDHILVDEAQDTSPAQWEVIEYLAREFAVGEGAQPERERTIFVVGDKKQSIYSFQGADPEGFDRMRDHFAGQLAQVGRPLQTEQLAYSFRSSSAILSLVDLTFAGHRSEGVGAGVTHYAFKDAMPGRVDLWPVVEEDKGTDDLVWYEPVDQISPQHHTVQLARRIAGEIRRMIDHETIPEEIGKSGVYQSRSITEGDVLILVQRRSDLFSEIIRACKDRGLNIAGADRLKIGGELAVKDIVALLRFLDLPEDDLSLAAALRSPLFGWSEQELYSVARPRPEGQTLWQAVREKAPPATMAVLNDLRGQSDFLRPYDLIERLLIRHEGRKGLLARLGDEAEDGIDALLSQALAYERTAIPSLTGFLNWLDTEEVEIKRQLDTAGDRIRVMTVHGSKGLEAPIVILPETQKRQNQVKSDLLNAGGHVVWKVAKDDQPPMMQALRIAQEEAQERERRRLLYVAMTRAEKWLVVAAAGEVGTGDESWYTMVADAMTHAGAVEHAFPFGPGMRYQHHDWAGLPPAPARPPAPGTPAAPVFAPCPPTEPVAQTLSPSDLGGDKVLPGEAAETDPEQAKARGRLIHLLLEHLPGAAPDDRLTLGRALLSASEDAALVGETEVLLADALRLISAPDLGPVFAPGRLAEVDVTATLEAFGGRRIHGTIDVLIVRDDSVLAIDFKSNRVVPQTADAVPEGLLRQLGAYHAALGQIYPGRRVETAILWTATGALMRLPDAQVMAALRRSDVA